jgi:hypothetical protein
MAPRASSKGYLKRGQWPRTGQTVMSPRLRKVPGTLEFLLIICATTVTTCHATAASIVLGMAFVCAKAEAANCGNDHKTGNEAEAATPWVTLFELRISSLSFQYDATELRKPGLNSSVTAAPPATGR